MPASPEELHPALTAAFNAGDLEAVLALYAPNAVFVTKPGHVTNGPAELRAALHRLLARGSQLTVHPTTYLRSDDVALVLGTYTLTGHRRDATPFALDGHFADILRLHPTGHWQIAVDNGFNDT